MAQSANITSTPAAAFTVPAGALGFHMQNESADAVRWLFSTKPATSGASIGMLLKAADSGNPGEFALMFPAPLAKPLIVFAVLSGGDTVNLTYQFIG